MPTNMNVQVEGLEKLLGKLDAHRLLGGPVHGLMEESAKFATKQAVEELERPVGATGRLAKAIKYSLAAGPIPLEAKVYHATPISLHVHEGRPAGLPQPPIAAMERWAARAHIGVAPFVLAKRIKERGTKGLFFMKKAAEATAQKLPEFVGKATRAIESIWGK